MVACHGEEFFSGIVRGGEWLRGRGTTQENQELGMDVQRTNWKALTYED